MFITLARGLGAVSQLSLLPRLIGVHELRGVDAKRLGELADGWWPRLGLVALDPNYGVYAHTSFLS